MEKSKVYYIKEITPENIVKLYEHLNINLTGNVGIKFHSGEKGNQNYLKPEMYFPIVKRLNATLLECNTAYPGSRNTTEKHMKLMEEHGWSTNFKVDILDADGDLMLDIPLHKVIDKNYVGKRILNYDSMLVLSHFKGHPMGGYGGALKQLSIGFASSFGKNYIHSAGGKAWTKNQDMFLLSMADAAKSVVDLFKDRICYINVMSNISVDCDCCSKAEDPCIEDLGILASLDPVSIDQACIDLVYNSSLEGKEHFIERVESRHGLLTIEAANEINVGSKEYEFIEIK